MSLSMTPPSPYMDLLPYALDYSDDSVTSKFKLNPSMVFANKLWVLIF